MGVIYYKNKQYASGGSTPGSSSEHIELTYAEYQALSEAEQKNGAVYFITDVDNDGGVIGYTGGTGITISEDKVIAIKDIKKNYVDNSNFRINTRGQSEYTTSDSSIYTVDRWYIDGGILAPVENGVQFTNTNTSAGSSSLIRLKQDIPYTFADLAGKTLTLSAKINGTIYTGKATLPSEKPTEGTAIQYIAVGIPAFGINLNYSITGDYFVPYLALAYTQSVLVEWMKLEVNDEFSGYVEPDYQTEKIKISFMSDNGKVIMPYTKTEVDNKIPSTTPVQLKVVAYDTLNSSTEEAKLIENVPWSQYELLIFTAGQFANAQSTIIIPTTYFNTTATGTRPIISFSPISNDGAVSKMYSVQIYKNDDNSVYVKAYTPVVENQRLTIYGCIKKI